MALVGGQGLLEMVVEDGAVGDDDDAVEDFFFLLVVQVGKEMAVQAMEWVLPEPAECWIR